MANVTTQTHVINWRAFLGAPGSSEIKRTPKGCIYDAQGYDSPRVMQIAKSLRYLEKRKVSYHVIKEFLEHAFLITGRPGDIGKGQKYLEKKSVNPEYVELFFQANLAANTHSTLPAWIDAAYLDIHDKWRKCGGKFEETASWFTPDKVHITITPTPLWLEQWRVYASGYYSWQTKRIRMVALTVAMLSTPQPGDEFIVSAKNLAGWEIGHILTDRYGHKLEKIPDDEIGDQVPCDFLRKIGKL